MANRAVLYFLFILAFFTSCQSGVEKEKTAKETETMSLSAEFDWQGHRGARGLMPENTIPAFLEALKYPVKTLELDVVISADSQVVISHEPWLSGEICVSPEGKLLSEEEGRELQIFGMTMEEIAAYDCGSRPHPRFPQQARVEAAKPSLREMVSAVERYCERTGRAKPFYNIELKARPEWDGKLTPPPARFSRLVLDELSELRIAERACIQSFDIRILREVHLRKPDLILALLVDEGEDGAQKLDELGFVPQIYSPYFPGLREEKVNEWHGRGMQVIPWTVNDIKTMKALIEMGVDGIITDYPNLISETN
jgi:glycerophosphoryl diester phosphodiesterase